MSAAVGLWPDQLLTATTLVYHSLGPQTYLLLGALFLARQEARAWTFLLAWTLTLVISMMVFPFVPALGSPPYAYTFESVFHAVRDGSLRTLDLHCLTGLTFPSFHAAAAVLLGWGFTSLRPAAILFVPFNVLMFGSALIVGGHYLIDLVAGAAVAAIAIAAAKRVQDRLGRRLPTPG